MKEGMEIAVVDYENSGIKWEKIVSIKQHEPQHVYDLMIEDTHNFIANDIIAHNTYIYDNTSIDSSTFYVDADNNRVGIGTTGPSEKLDVNSGNICLKGEKE